MSKDNLRDAIYLKGKESFFIGTLMIILVIIFIVPITLVLFLRFILKLIFKAKNKMQEEGEVAASKISSNKESLMI